MDDIVIVILTILIAVVGILGQRKKQKDAQAAGKTQAKKPMDFWELLQEESNMDSSFQQYEPVMEEEEERVDTVPEERPVYQFKTENEGVSNIVEQVKEETKTKKKELLMVYLLQKIQKEIKLFKLKQEIKEYQN